MVRWHDNLPTGRRRQCNGYASASRRGSRYRSRSQSVDVLPECGLLPTSQDREGLDEDLAEHVGAERARFEQVDGVSRSEFGNRSRVSSLTCRPRFAAGGSTGWRARPSAPAANRARECQVRVRVGRGRADLKSSGVPDGPARESGPRRPVVPLAPGHAVGRERVVLQSLVGVDALCRFTAVRSVMCSRTPRQDARKIGVVLQQTRSSSEPLARDCHGGGDRFPPRPGTASA